MRGWNKAAAMLAALAAQPVAARGPLDRAFCAELERIVRAADDAEPFRRLEISRGAPPTLGFVHGCRRSGGERRYFWLCGQNLAPESLSADRLAERTSACLPGAEPLPRRHPGERRFAVGAVEIRIHESGGPRAHVGRIVSYVVAAPPVE